MNLIRSFALLIAVAFSIQAAGSSEQGTTSSRSGTALLHCDPGAHILTIDGARSRMSPNDGREDCAIPLPAGAHSVEVAFNGDAGLRTRKSGLGKVLGRGPFALKRLQVVSIGSNLTSKELRGAG